MKNMVLYVVDGITKPKILTQGRKTLIKGLYVGRRIACINYKLRRWKVEGGWIIIGYIIGLSILFLSILSVIPLYNRKCHREKRESSNDQANRF